MLHNALGRNSIFPFLKFEFRVRQGQKKKKKVSVPLSAKRPPPLRRSPSKLRSPVQRLRH